MSPRFARAVTLAATSLSLCGAAHALSVTYSGSTGVGAATGTLTLQQFDSTLGTLTGIELVWDSGFNGTYRASAATPSGTGTASGANNFVTSTTVAQATPAGVSGPDLTGTAGSAFSVAVPPSYSQFFAGGAIDAQAYGPLASFIGLGTVGYTLQHQLLATASTSAGILGGITDSLFLVTADVTYTYAAPVPEASQWAMLLAGLGAIGFLARRRA